MFYLVYTSELRQNKPTKIDKHLGDISSCPITIWPSYVIHVSEHIRITFPDSKIHLANIGPTWVLLAPRGPHVGHMDFAVWIGIRKMLATDDSQKHNLVFLVALAETEIIDLRNSCQSFYLYGKMACWHEMHVTQQSYQQHSWQGIACYLIFYDTPGAIISFVARLSEWDASSWMTNIESSNERYITTFSYALSSRHLHIVYI